MRKYPTHFYEFGPFRLDVNERVLVRGNEKLPLTPKVFETLLALIEAGGGLVEKSDLMTRVWPDSVVEDANLTQNISILRKALGEDSGARQFIETVPKHGYRLTAEVRETRVENGALIVEEHTRSRVLIPDEETTSAKNRLRYLPERISVALTRASLPKAFTIQITPLRVAGAIGAAGLILGLSLWLLFGQSQRPAPDFIEPQFTSLFDLAGNDSEALRHSRLSPDGKFIVYPKTGSDGLHIWLAQAVGQATESERRQITSGKQADGSPIWSPDGQFIAFSSDRDKEHSIRVVPLLGGPPASLVALGFDKGFNIGALPLLKKWTENGAVYFEWGPNLYRLDKDAKTPKQLTNFDASRRSIKDFALSPDATQAVYVDSDGKQTDLWQIKLNDPQATPIRLTNDKAGKFQPVWHPDGNRIIYSGRENNDLHIYALDLSTGSKVQITRGSEQYLAIDIFANNDRTRILCVAERDESAVFSVMVEGGQETRLTDEAGANFWPAFSPDGTSFLFQTLRGDRFHWDPLRSLISIRSTGGAQTAQIISNAFNTQWAPDGDSLAFMRMSGNMAELWTIRSGGGDEKLLPVGNVSYGGFNENPPYDRRQTKDYSWSPDSSQIAYCSTQDRITNVRIATVESGASISITSNQDKQTRYFCPLWSPDGRQIAYVANRRPPSDTLSENSKAVWELWVYAQGNSELVHQTYDILRLAGWSSENELIIATMAPTQTKITSPAPVTLLGLFPIGRVERRIGALENVYPNSLQLSQDGRNVSYVKSQGNRDDIWIVSIVGSRAREWKVTNNTDPAVHFSSIAWSPDNGTLYYDRQIRRSLLRTIDNFK